MEAAQAWLENVTYQMTRMSHKEQSDKLAGCVRLSFSDFNSIDSPIF